jgi:hypothetical protein
MAGHMAEARAAFRGQSGKMDKTIIKVLAVTNGFSLKQQGDGSMDLNPYVYEFADALLNYRDLQAEKHLKLQTNKWTNG